MKTYLLNGQFLDTKLSEMYIKKMELESGLMLKEATSNFDILQHLQCLDKISGKSLIWYCH